MRPFSTEIDENSLVVTFGPLQTVDQVVKYHGELVNALKGFESCTTCRFDLSNVLNTDYSFFQVLFLVVRMFKDRFQIEITESDHVQTYQKYLSPSWKRVCKNG